MLQSNVEREAPKHLPSILSELSVQVQKTLGSGDLMTREEGFTWVGQDGYVQAEVDRKSLLDGLPNNVLQTSFLSQEKFLNNRATGVQQSNSFA